MGKSKPKFKMPIGERAKQFAPFSPLSTLEQALADQVRRREKRRYPDSDTVAEINSVLTELKKGDVASVFFYNETDIRYEQAEGEVRIIDSLHKRLFICGREINFGDILEISIVETRREN